MEALQHIIALIGLAIMILFIIGLFSPQKSLFWYKGERTRWKSNTVYLSTFVILSLLNGLFESTQQKDIKDNSKAITENKVVESKDTIQKKVNGNTETMIKYDVNGNKIGTEEVIIEKNDIEKKAENLFSPWDGSNRKLVKAVKNAMNDASSFEHINTSYIIKEGFVYARMDYRGKNGFGAFMKESVLAQIDPESGEVVSLAKIE